MAGINGKGAALQRGDGATPTENFTTIANVTSIEGPGLEREEIDVTAHDTDGNFMEFVPGLVDPDEVEIEVNYDPIEHDALIAAFDDDAPRNYRLVFPDPDPPTELFLALLWACPRQGPADGELASAVTFTVTGGSARSTESWGRDGTDTGAD